MAKIALHEIERKFLLKKLPAKLESYHHGTIAQGYLAIEPGGLQVRLRRRGAICTLTFKRKHGIGREEREVRISRAQYNALWPATVGRRLSKIRYDVPWKNHIIEIDVYTGRHEGLVVAEVEFSDEKKCQNFKPPSWFGAEITGRSRYSNVRMAHE